MLFIVSWFTDPLLDLNGRSPEPLFNATLVLGSRPSSVIPSYVLMPTRSLRFPKQTKYPAPVPSSEKNPSVLAGDDLPVLREICENLDPEHQEVLGYDLSRTDGRDPLEAVRDTLQFAHHQRVVARTKFGKNPETSFDYYRVIDDQDKTLRFCNICLFEVINGTGMIKLPCRHTFSVRTLFNFLTKSGSMLPESWGCP